MATLVATQSRSGSLSDGRSETRLLVGGIDRALVNSQRPARGTPDADGVEAVTGVLRRSTEAETGGMVIVVGERSTGGSRRSGFRSVWRGRSSRYSLSGSLGGGRTGK